MTSRQVDPTLDSAVPAPEREGIWDPLKRGDLAGALRGFGRLILPTAGLEGQRSLSDLFAGLVEYTKIGDVGDFFAGVDPESGLDPIERALAIAGIGSVAGVAGLGVKHAYRSRARSLLEQSINRTMRLPGGRYDFTREFDLSDTPNAEFDEAQVREHQAYMEQLHLESRSPFIRGVLRAKDWDGLAVAADSDPNTVRAVGAAVLATSPNPWIYDNSEFTAAQAAIAKYQRAVDLDLLTFVDTKGKRLKSVDLDELTQLELMVQLETLTSSFVGPDLLLDVTGRIGQIRIVQQDLGNGEYAYQARVAVGVIDELLPSLRIFDHHKLIPENESEINRRLGSSDWEQLTGMQATNILRSLVEDAYLPDGSWDENKVGWYRKFNQSVKVLADATGYSETQVAGVIGALSANTPWHHNLVSAIHTVLQLGRPDLAVGSPEYNQIFKDATIGSGWGPDIYQYSGEEVRNLSPEGQFEQSVMHYADPESIRGKGGMLAGTDADKLEKVDLILKGNLPPWIVMRMMKTNSFGRLGAEPNLKEFADLVTIDRHVTNLAAGSVWVGRVLAHAGRKNLKFDPEATYIDPITGQSIVGKDLRRAFELMEKEFGWTPEQVERWEKLIATFPSELALQRYRALTQSFLLARDVAGLEFGHEVQAGSWGFGQKMDRLNVSRALTQIDEATDVEEIRAITKQATFDTSVLRALEGAPPHGITAAGYLWDVAPGLSGPLPTVKDLDAAAKGMRRPASGSVHSAIVVDFGPEGAQVYVDSTRLDQPGVAETLRHLAPSGVAVGKWQRWVPRAERSVASVADHLKTVSSYTDEAGLPLGAEITTYVSLTEQAHPAIRPGNRIVALVPQALLQDFNHVLADLPHGTVEVEKANRSRIGASRSHLDLLDDLEGLTKEQFTELLRSVDWYAIAADDIDALRKDVERLGGHAAQAKGYWINDQGRIDNEDSLFITGITPQQAFDLGVKYDQESIASRWGFVWTTTEKAGTYHPSTGEYFLDENAKPEAWTHFSGIKRKFTAGFDWDVSLPFDPSPEGLRQMTAHGIAPAAPMAMVTIDFGGREGSFSWTDMQRTIDGLSALPGVDLRVYTHAANMVPNGFVRAKEAVFRDQSGVVGSVLFAGDGDVAARHQADVWVPALKAKGLSAEGFHAESLTRDPKTARDIMEINEESGEIWIDGDVMIKVDPTKNVKILKTGPILKAMRIGSKRVTHAMVDIRGDIPVIHPNLDVDPEPGMIRVELSEGEVTAIDVFEGDDWLPARDALAATGILVGENIDVRTPGEGRAVYSNPQRALDNYQLLGWGYGWEHAMDKMKLTTDADVAMLEDLKAKGFELNRIGLGALPDARTREVLAQTISDLSDGAGVYADAAALVGPVPQHIWKGQSLAVADLRTIEAEMGHVFKAGKPEAFKGIVIDEGWFGRWANTGVRPRHIYLPPNATNTQATFTHEVGHLVASYIPSHQFETMVRDTITKIGDDVGTRTALSRYATANIREFFAEAFAKVMFEPHKAAVPLVDLVRQALDVARNSTTQYEHTME